MTELIAERGVLRIGRLASEVALQVKSILRKLRQAPQLLKCHLYRVRDFRILLQTLEYAVKRESVDHDSLQDIISEESQSSAIELLENCSQEASSCYVILQSTMPEHESDSKECSTKTSNISVEEEIQERLNNLNSLHLQLRIWYSHQVMLSTCQTNLCMTKLDSRLRALRDDVLKGLSVREPSTTAIQRLGGELCNRLASRPSLLANLTQGDALPPNYPGCRCSWMLKSTCSKTHGALSHEHRYAGIHKRGCPYVKWSFSKTVESRWRWCLLSRSIEITLARGQSLNTSILFGLTIIPIVESSTAPSFNRFRDADLEIRRTLRTSLSWPPCPFRGLITQEKTMKVMQIMQRLLDGLVEDLQNDKYSAREQSACGETLLHAYGNLLVGIWHFQNEVYDIIAETVKILVERGASVNAMIPEPNTFTISGQTTLFTPLSLLLLNVRTRDVLRLGQTASIPRIFSQYDMHGFSSTLFNDLRQVGIFAQAPDLAIEYGCSQLSLAVVQRDRFEVKRLLESHHNVNDTISTPLSPLCFAIGWSAGAELLLDAGADPSAAIHCAILYGDDKALRSLLSHKCRLFAQLPRANVYDLWSMNRFSSSVLSFVLWRERIGQMNGRKSTTFVANAIANARQELMDLGKTILSVPQLKRCKWNNLSNNILVSDAVATELVQSLLAENIYVPPALYPSTKTSIYHEKWMTVKVADDLFKAGFEEIDLIDIAGRTPLLLNAHFSRGDCFDRISTLCWFLYHGSKHVVFPHLNGNSLPHILAANLGRAWHPEPPMGDNLYKSYNNDLYVQAEAALPAVLDQVWALVGPCQPDNCQCLCSQAGCLPVHALLKHMRCTGWSSAWPRNNWSTWSDEQIVLNLWWSQCAATDTIRQLERSEVCRLQIFNRLDMRHTCCSFGVGEDISETDGFVHYLSPTLRVTDESERSQFQQEDAYSEYQLDAFMALYQELDTMYQRASMVFWDTWWAVLEEYIPSANWSLPYHSRHVQIHDHLLPIEEDELDAKIDQVRDRIMADMAASLEDSTQRRLIRSGGL